MKIITLIFFSLTLVLNLSSQTAYDETEPIENLPTGIFYQKGPGSNNTLNWTYPYSTKLTINNDVSRNFEFSTTGKDNESFVVRQFSQTTNDWTFWKKIILDDGNGNVGIGVSSPETKLHIRNGVVTSGTAAATYGSLQFAGDYYDNNIINTYGSQYSSGATSIGYAVKQKSGSTGFVSSAGNASFKKGMLIIDSELEFLNAPASTVAIDNDVIMNSRFKIDENGNVGIGTTTPTNKLEVNGTIRSKEVKVEAAPWPDFVFTEEHELPDLQEVNTYIQQNGHLPEIPTAQEVEENGISLGEMNAKLLQKIEELTLYVIELKEELDTLKKEIKNK